MKAENTSTEKLVAEVNALLTKVKEKTNEIKRKKALAREGRREILRHATAVFGGYVVYQADREQVATLITAALKHEKTKRAREALELLAVEHGFTL